MLKSPPAYTGGPAGKSRSSAAEPCGHVRGTVRGQINGHSPVGKTRGPDVSGNGISRDKNMLLGDRARRRHDDGDAAGLAGSQPGGRGRVDVTGLKQRGLGVLVTLQPVCLLQEDRPASAKPGVHYATLGLILSGMESTRRAQVPARNPGAGRLVKRGDSSGQAAHRGVSKKQAPGEPGGQGPRVQESPQARR